MCDEKGFAAPVHLQIKQESVSDCLAAKSLSASIHLGVRCFPDQGKPFEKASRRKAGEILTGERGK